MPAERLCSRGDGRKAYRRGLCQACYRAAPRVQEQAAPGEGAVLAPLRVSRAWARAVALAAQRAGVTEAQWRRAAIRAALVHQAYADRQLHAELLELFGEEFQQPGAAPP